MEIRGKIALLFHLLITTKAPPPISATTTRTHVYVHANNPVLESISAQLLKSQIVQNHSFLSSLVCLASFIYLFFSPHQPLTLLPGILGFTCSPLPSVYPPTQPSLPSSPATTQQSREQSLGGSARLNCHRNPLGFHLLVLS